MALVAKAPVLIPQTIQILLLETILRHSPLLLQVCRLLLQAALLLIETLPIFRQALLLLVNQLLLTLL